MKRIICVLLAALVFMCLISVPAFADGAIISISKTDIAVGDTVTVNVGYNADSQMHGVELDLTYNNAVFKYVCGGDSDDGKTIRIVPDNLNGEKSVSYSVKFKAIAAGDPSLSLLGTASKQTPEGQFVDVTSSNSLRVTVSAAKPSTNANLGSLKVNTGELTPAFKAATTEYTVTVRYPTDKITLRANAAMGDSKVDGAGTFTLKVGENKQSITVTAAAGNKKTYNVTIKRLSEEETAAEELKELENDPLFFKYNDTGRLLTADVSGMSDFEGYTKSVFESGEKKIGYFADKAGKYNLFWATDLEGGGGTFYNRLTTGEFQKVNYINEDKNLYIIEPFEEDINVGEKYSPSNIEINGDDVECYKYSDENDDELYVFYCYANGENGYYAYSPAKGTIKPEPEFLAADVAAAPEQSEGLLDKFNNLGTEAKIVVILLGAAALLVLVLIILLIIKAAGGSKKPGDIDELSKEIDYAIVGYEAEKETEEAQPEADPVGEELEMIMPEAGQDEAPEVEEPAQETEQAPAEEDTVASEIENTDEYIAGDSDGSQEEQDDPDVDPLAPDTAIIDTSEFIDLEDDL